MIRPRVSIAGLMGVVLVSAVGVAALKVASPLWASAVLTASLGLLGLAILGAIFRSGETRAFWVGVAVLGWGYMTLAFGPWFATEIEPKLATSKALTAMQEKIHPGPMETSAVISANANVLYSNLVQVTGAIQGQGIPRVAVTGSNNSTTGGTPAPMTFVLTSAAAPASNRDDFFRIGHSLFALLGGLAARGFAKRPQPSLALEVTT